MLLGMVLRLVFVGYLLLVSVNWVYADHDGTNCVRDVLGHISGNICTANDVDFASVTQTSNVTECVAGELVTIDLVANVDIQGQNTRYDIGVYFAKESVDAITGTCDYVQFETASPIPTQGTVTPDVFDNLDGGVVESCGDKTGISGNNSEILDYPMDSITVTCIPDALGQLSLATVTIWDNSASQDTCDALPETSAKCNASTGGIGIDVKGRLTIHKDTFDSNGQQNAIDQDFDFTVDGPGNFDQSGTINTVTSPADIVINDLVTGDYTVEETQIAGWNLTKAECTYITYSVSPGGIRVETVNTIEDGDDGNVDGVITLSGLQGYENVICTFENQVQTAEIVVAKELTPVDGDDAFDLLINGNTVFDDAVDGDSSTSVTFDIGSDITVAEIAGNVTTSLDDYNTSLVCSYANGNGTIIFSSSDLTDATERTGDFTIPGDAANDIITCTFTNTVQPGTLIVNKLVINDDGGTSTAGDFSFQVNGDPAVTFDETGDNDQDPLTGSNTISVDAGNYTITEPTVSGYATTYNNCTDVFVPNGGTATCTITNDDQAGTLIVNKLVINDDGGTSTAGDFSFQVNGDPAVTFDETGDNDQDPLTGSNTISVDAGNYTITEPTVSGYATTYNNCTDVFVPNGGTATCTITNDDQAGTLIVNKLVINDDGGTSTAGDFSFQVNGDPAVTFDETGDNDQDPLTGSNTISVDAGNYTITEPTVSGYATTYNNCTDVFVPNGGTATCTITNDDQAGTLIVNKLVINDDGGTSTAGDFSFQVNGDPAVTFDETGDNDQDPLTGSNTISVDAGNYTITEPTVSGYATTYNNCTDVFVPNGGTETCTITNQDIGPKLTVIKTINNNNGGTVTDPDAFSLTVDSNSVSSGVANTYTAGVALEINETLVDGYEFVSITGNNRCPSVLGGTITLAVGDDVTCTITNQDIGPKLTVIKTINNNNGGTVTDPDAFSLTVGGNSVSSGVANTYTAGVALEINETLVDGYEFVSITGDAKCPDVLGGTITLAVGDDVTCTITNQDIAPKLTIVKTINNNNGGTVTDPDAFSLTVGGNSVSSGVANTYTAGVALEINETLVNGYEFVSITGDGCPTALGGTITLAVGDDVTCTITNQDIGPKLTVIKTINNNNGGTVTDPDAFSLTVGGNSVSSGVANTYTAGVALEINETLVDGYEFVSITGDAKCPDVLGGTITLAVGDDVTCTITNQDIAPKLTIVKTINNNNGGTVTDPDAFSLTVGGNSVSSGVANTYTAGVALEINETLVNGYEFVSITGDGCPTALGGTITLAVGDDVTCTITNQDIGPKLTVIKTINNNNGGTVTDPDAFSLTVGGNSVSSGVANTYTAGVALEINETLVDGYEFVSITGDAKCPDVLGGTITLAVGDDVTCTITNQDIAPKLTIVKTINNNNGGTVTDPDAFSLTVGGNSVSSGVANTYTAGVALEINETLVNGYEFVSITGDGCPTALGGTITLAVGDDVTCTITNQDIGPKLTVIKTINNNNGGTVTDPDAFSLTVGGNSVSSGVANTYTAGVALEINETLVDGYEFVSITGDAKCPDVLGGTITLAVGDDVTCTITNQDIAPKLTIVKTINNNNGGTVTDPDAFSLTVGGNSVSSGVANTYTAGVALEINETLVNGYEFVSITGDGCPTALGGTITLAVGDDVTCTITNQDIGPKLTVIKTINNNNGGTVTDPDAFSLTVGGNSVSSGVANTYTAGVALEINETLVDGYEFVSITGDGCPTVLGGTITLAVGDDVTCTITNTDQPGTLIVNKVVVNANGGVKTAGEFNFQINGGTETAFDETGDNDQDPLTGSNTISVDAGTYTIIEPAVDGYTTTYNNCTDVVVPNGATETCTITNKKDNPLLDVTKSVSSITNPAVSQDPTNTSTVDEDGDVINYLITVANAGDITLYPSLIDTLTAAGVPTDVSSSVAGPFTDSAGTILETDGELNVGQTWYYTFSYEVTQSDINDGSDILNEACVSDQQVGAEEDCDTITTTLPRESGLTVLKTASGDVIDANGDGELNAGDQQVYNYSVENTGDVTLFNITLSDDAGTPGDTSDDFEITLTSGLTDEDTDGDLDDLAVGAIATGQATYTFTQADLDAGGHNNLATGTGEDPEGELVEDEDTEEVDLERNPLLDVTKSVSSITNPAVSQDPTNTSTVDEAGDVINYLIAVANAGNVTLYPSLIDTLTAAGVPTDVSSSVAGPFTDSAGTILETDGELNVGQTWYYTFSYEVTQSDINDGSDILNEACVSDQQVGAEEDCDTTTTTLPRESGLTVLKTASGDVIDANGDGELNAGDQQVYNYSVENTGDVTLFNITLSDDAGTPGDTSDDFEITLTSGLTDEDTDGDLDDLAVGAIATGQATYTFTQADLDAGGHNNLATGTGEDPEGELVEDEDTEEVDLERNPLLDVTKSVSSITNPAVSQDPTNTSTVDEAGDVINYLIAVANAGNVTLYPSLIDTLTAAGVPTDVSSSVAGPFTDSAGTILETDGELNVGQTWYYTFSYEVTQSDINDGSDILNEACVSDQQVGAEEDCDTITTTLPRESGLTVLKTASGDVIDANGDGELNAGDQQVYNYSVENTGDVTLFNITLSDDAGTPGDTSDDFEITLTSGLTDEDTDGDLDDLAIGAIATGQATYTFTQADLDAGGHNNLATGTGEDPEGEPVEDEDTEEVDLERNPLLDVTKSVSSITNPAVSQDPTNTSTVDEAGDVINYLIAVANAGNVTLYPSLIDTLTAAGVPTDVSSSVAGPFTDSAGTILETDGELNVGQTWYYTFSYEVTQSDINDGSDILNEACVSDQQVGAEEDCDTITTTLPRESGLTVLKTASGDVIDANGDGELNAGDQQVYNYSVENTGDVTLFNITLSDDAGTPGDTSDDFEITLTSGLTDEDTDGDLDDLAIGAIATGQATYTFTQADLDAGGHNNLATGTGDCPDGTEDCASDDDSHEKELPRNEGIEIIKLGVFQDENSDGIVQVGETIFYTFDIKNTGNVTLNNINITDPIVSVDCTSFDGILGPGESFQCKGSYVVTSADINAGSRYNLATVTGDCPDGTEDCADDSNDHEEPLPSNEGLGIVKEGEFQDESGDGFAQVGETITYTFEVTNTGGVTLTNVDVTDSLPLVNGVICDWDNSTDATTPAGTLSVGEVVDCTGTYEVTQSDIDAGSRSNLATVTGDCPSGTEDCAEGEDNHEEPLPSNEGLGIVKEGEFQDESGDGLAQVGETIAYTFEVTNTGGVTLTNVDVTDSLPLVNGVICDWDNSTDATTPAGTLSVGEVVDCIGTYEVTQSDIDAGSRSNLATVTGDCPSGTEDCAEGEDNHEEPLPSNEGLGIVKEGEFQDESGDGLAQVGETIAYTFEVTNTGGVTLTNVDVTDSLPLVNGVICDWDNSTDATTPAGTLSVGEVVDCIGTYEVTQSDIDVGSRSNLATVTGDCPSGTEDCAEGEDNHEEPLPSNEGLGIVKEGEFQDESGDGFAQVGETITYTFEVTNTGGVTLTNVDVTDSLQLVNGVICDWDNSTDATTPAGTLSVGEVVNCTGTYVLTQADINAGEVVNTATADSNETDPVEDTEITDVPQGPALTVDKVLTSNADEDGSGTVNLGDTLTYTITTTNTGNVTLNNVTVADSLIANLTCNPTIPATLAPGEQIVCTGTYTITQADIDGTGNAVDSDDDGDLEIINIGTADSDETDPIEDTETVDVVREPKLTLTKEVDTDSNGTFQLGSTVNYIVTITNEGPVDVVADVVDSPSIYLSYVFDSAVITTKTTDDPNDSGEFIAVEPEIVTVNDQTGEQQLIWRDVSFPIDKTVIITYQMTIAESIPVEERDSLTNIVTVRDLEDDATIPTVIVAADNINSFRLTENVLIGRVYLDVDNDGSYDGGDMPLPGARIVLSNGWQTITDFEGNYAFRAVPTGTASVKLDESTAPYLPRENHEGIDEGYLHQVSMFGVTISDFPLMVPEGIVSVQRRTTVMFGPITLEKHHVPLPEGVRVVLHVSSSDVLPASIILRDPVPGGEEQVFEFGEVIEEQTLTYDVPVEIPMTDPVFEWGNQ